MKISIPGAYCRVPVCHLYLEENSTEGGKSACEKGSGLRMRANDDAPVGGENGKTKE